MKQFQSGTKCTRKICRGGSSFESLQDSNTLRDMVRKYLYFLRFSSWTGGMWKILGFPEIIPLPPKPPPKISSPKKISQKRPPLGIFRENSTNFWHFPDFLPILHVLKLASLKEFLLSTSHRPFCATFWTLLRWRFFVEFFRKKIQKNIKTPSKKIQKHQHIGRCQRTSSFRWIWENIKWARSNEMGCIRRCCIPHVWENVHTALHTLFCRLFGTHMWHNENSYLRETNHNFAKETKKQSEAGQRKNWAQKRKSYI